MEPTRADRPSLPQDHPSEVKRDLEAALQTRKELGAEYESELIDSFLSRIDARLDARVEQRVAERLHRYEDQEQPAKQRERRERKRGWGNGSLSTVSLVLAIPLTGIGASHGLSGMFITWAGIVGVNLAHAIGSKLNHGEERRAAPPRSEWA
jgi:hypothetical protein